MGTLHDELKRELEGERDRLLLEKQRFRIAGRTNLGYGNHQADDATDAFEQAKEFSLLQNAERVLAQVEAALDRLKNGSYGICKRCNETIDPARLKALPYASLCVRCQAQLELV